MREQLLASIMTYMNLLPEDKLRTLLIIILHMR